MTTIATIQARTDSTRLPGKVMYPLDGTPVLVRAVERDDLAPTEAIEILYAMDETGARLSASLVHRVRQRIKDT